MSRELESQYESHRLYSCPVFAVKICLLMYVVAKNTDLELWDAFQNEEDLNRLRHFRVAARYIHLSLSKNEVYTTGYVGLGFSPNGGMKDSDVVIGWVNDVTGQITFHDRYAFGLMTPSVDASQDYELLGGFQNNTHTVLRFARPWVTCDRDSDRMLSEDTTRVIWSYDAVDPEQTDLIPLHDHRGTKSLYLKEPQVDFRTTRAPDVMHFDLRAPNVTCFPEDIHTLYWCKLYKLTLKGNDKTQAIGYVPLVDETNVAPWCTHMILYEGHLPNHAGSQCYMNMPPSWYMSNTPIISWAHWGTGEMYPDHVGYPLGEDNQGATYFLLEIHYDNPDFKSDHGALAQNHRVPFRGDCVGGGGGGGDGSGNVSDGFDDSRFEFLWCIQSNKSITEVMRFATICSDITLVADKHQATHEENMGDWKAPEYWKRIRAGLKSSEILAAAQCCLNTAKAVRYELENCDGDVEAVDSRKDQSRSSDSVRTTKFVEKLFKIGAARSRQSVQVAATGGFIPEDRIRVHVDRYAFGLMTPSVDASQDYELLGGFQNNTHTVLRFARPWVTCDRDSDRMLSEDTTRVIWSYDAVDPEQTDLIPLHDHRGTKSLYLKEPQVDFRTTRAPDVMHFDLRAPNVTVPEDIHTLYWCKLYKLPERKRKTQAIGYVPLVDETNVAHVHHMILYECHLPNSHLLMEKWTSHAGSQCYMNMPPSWYMCNTPIISWAIGSQGEMYPDHVGYPLGEDNQGATYFLLEIHYDNPDFKSGIVDNSGLRLYYTERLRKYDAGILTVGHNVRPDLIIPPGTRWTTTGHCTKDCLAKSLPNEGVKVFSAVLHSHLLGKSITLRHIRKGRELPFAFQDTNYDFNYQQVRIPPSEISLLPGDHLITECLYDSGRRAKPTYGGFGTEDEMCLVFLGYYPRMELSECHSSPDFSLLLNTFGVDIYNREEIMKALRLPPREGPISPEADEKVMDQMGKDLKNIFLGAFFKGVWISEPPELKDQPFFEIVNNGGWWRNKTFLKEFKNVVSYGQFESFCYKHGRIPFDQMSERTEYPNFTAIKTLETSCIPAPIGKYFPASVPPEKWREDSGNENTGKNIAGSSSSTKNNVPREELSETEIEGTRSLQGRNASGKSYLHAFLFYISLAPLIGRLLIRPT
ncbi:uncharacterized protein LOC143027356 [Oratosquilla oratoria]|uniref:uncharacterized protein LOC143027356 n=1 Tax=Oratosquilla oratoria TaxID=337810 RepID=UPI003F769FFC